MTAKATDLGAYAEAHLDLHAKLARVEGHLADLVHGLLLELGADNTAGGTRREEGRRVAMALGVPRAAHEAAAPTRLGKAHGAEVSSTSGAAESRTVSRDTTCAAGAASKSMRAFTTGATAAGAATEARRLSACTGAAAALQLTRMLRRSTLLAELRTARRAPEAQRRATQLRLQTRLPAVRSCTRVGPPTAVGVYFTPGPTGAAPMGG